MSSQQEQAAVQAAADAMALNYILMASLALVAYDSLLTLIEEVPHIWKKKWKLGTALYFLARYTVLLYLLIQTIGYSVNFTSLQRIRTCNAVARFEFALIIPGVIGIQGFLLALAYAVTDHKRLILAVLGILGVCIIVSGLAMASLDNCLLTSAQVHTVMIRKTRESEFIIALLIVFSVGDVSAIPIILFDIIVVAVTLAGTRGTWRVYKQSTWNRRTLTHLLVEKSLMRFGFVLIITVTNAILPLVVRPTCAAVFAPIQNSLSVVIICRFHLDLLRRNAHFNSNASQDLSTISFRSFRAASQGIHDAVMVEFGDSLVNENAEGNRSREEEAEPNMPEMTTEHSTELDESQSRQPEC